MTNPLHPPSVVVLLPHPRGGCSRQADRAAGVIGDGAAVSLSRAMATRHASGVLCTALPQSLLGHGSRYREDSALSSSGLS